jgi:hypothetical protein
MYKSTPLSTNSYDSSTNFQIIQTVGSYTAPAPPPVLSKLTTDSTYEVIVNGSAHVRDRLYCGNINQLVNDGTVGDPANVYTNTLFATSQTKYSIICQNDIYTNGTFITASDRRIKRDIQTYNVANALDQINDLRVVEYKKINDENNGIEIGFIAQEVKEVIPESVDTSPGFIPTIYKSVPFTKQGERYIRIVNTFAFQFNEMVQILDDNKEAFQTIVVDVEDDYAVMKLSSDASPLLKGDTVFIYGTAIKDFHSIDKDVVFSVAVAAIQRLSTKVERQEQTISTLQDRLERLERLLATA